MHVPASPATERLCEGLTTYLVTTRGPSITVRELRRLTGGTSHETWAFDLYPDGRADQKPQAMILRRDFSQDHLDLTLATEFPLLKRLHAAGVPVPEPLYCESDSRWLGTAFIISERLAGADIRKRMATGSDGARELGLELAGILARIHRLDGRKLVAGLMSAETDVAAEQVRRWSGIALEFVRSPSPLLLAAIDWLAAHTPNGNGCALVHGDFKANNLVFDSTGRVAVIDWELSHLGDPLEDLAFTMLWTSKYDLVGGMLSDQAFIKAYEQASGTTVDRERLFFWQMFAQVKIAAIFLKGIVTPNSAVFPRPSLVQLGRAMPWVEQRLAELLRRALNERAAA